MRLEAIGVRIIAGKFGQNGTCAEPWRAKVTEKKGLFNLKKNREHLKFIFSQGLRALIRFPEIFYFF